MDKTEHLKEIISNYWQLSDPQLDWGMEFNSRHLSNFSSLRMLRFLASVEERFRINIEDPDAIKSFEDLRKLVRTTEGVG